MPEEEELEEVLEILDKTGVADSAELPSDTQGSFEKRKKQAKEIFDSFKEETSNYDPESTLSLMRQGGDGENGQRIFYSELTHDIFSIDDQIRSRIHTNLEKLMEYVDEKGIDNKIVENVIRIWDHFNLATLQVETIHKTFDEGIKKLNKQTDEVVDTIKKQEDNVGKLKKDIKKTYEETSKKLSSAQTDSITILGIFAAIVFVFSGGIELLGSALTGLESAPFFKSAFFVLLCGFVVVNAIFMLLYIIAKMTEKNIYASCKTETCTCEKRCKPLERVKKRLPYVYWLNVVILIAMIVVLVSMLIADKTNAIADYIFRWFHRR